jgi:hypothetical protein
MATRFRQGKIKRQRTKPVTHLCQNNVHLVVATSAWETKWIFQEGKGVLWKRRAKCVKGKMKEKGR